MSPGLNYPVLDDRDLVNAARQGDTAAFEELVRRYAGLVYARAMILVRNPDDALDISQDAWVRAWRGLKRFKGNCSFATWMTRVVTNLCIDRARRMRRFHAESIDQLAEESGGVERLIEPVEQDPLRNLDLQDKKRVIWQALETLSDAHRTVLVLHEFEHMSYKEIAKAMRCSIGTVMSRLFHARRKFAAAVAKIARHQR